MVSANTAVYRDNLYGEVAERLNAPVLKTGGPSRVPRVRISPSPQHKKRALKCVLFLFSKQTDNNIETTY